MVNRILAAVLVLGAAAGCGGGGGGSGPSGGTAVAALAGTAWTTAAGAVDVTLGTGGTCKATFAITVVEPTTAVAEGATATLRYYAIETMTSGCFALEGNYQKFGSAAEPCTATLDTSTTPATLTLAACRVVNGRSAACDTGGSGGTAAHSTGGAATIAYDGSAGALTWPSQQYTWNTDCSQSQLRVDLAGFTPSLAASP